LKKELGKTFGPGTFFRSMEERTCNSEAENLGQYRETCF
jgi:hypothetical protein